MALSGSTPKVYTDKGAFWTWIEWTATQNIANNTSTVTANLYLGTNSYGYISYAGGSPNIVLDGTTKTLSPITINKNTTKKLVGSYTKTITHNSDGKKSFSLGGRYHHSSTSLTITLNIPTTYPTLDTIPRYAKITSFTVSDVRIDRATINYSTDKAVTNVRYAIWNTNGTVFKSWTSASNELTITGLAPNTSYDIGIRVTNPTSGLETFSAKRRITTVRLSTGTIVNRNVHAGNPIILNISRANSNITHNVTMQVSNDSKNYVNLKTVNGVGTSVDLTLSSAERDLYYQNRKLGKNSNYRVLIKSIWGGEKGSVYSNTAVLTMTDNEVIPTLSEVTYEDINTIAQDIIRNDQKILRNISTVRFNAGTASPKKWSSIKSYTVTFNGNTFTKNSSTTTGVYIDTGKVNATKATTATLTVTDSRGFTASKSITVQMLDYLPPQLIQASADRLNSYEQQTTLNVESRRAIVRPLDLDVNEIEMRYRIKENPSGTYGGYISLTSESSSTIGLWKSFITSQYMADYPNNKSYTIELGIKDKFTTWNNILITLTEGIALLSFLRDRVTMRGNFFANTEAGEVQLTPTGWRNQVRSTLKVQTNSDNPAEIDLRNLKDGVSQGWQITSRGSADNNKLLFYYNDELPAKDGGDSNSLGTWKEVFSLFPTGEIADSFGTLQSVSEYDSGIWHVRKWKSGYIEMSARKELVSFSSLSLSGNIYYGSCGGYTYPIPLTKLYSVSFGFQSTTSNVWYWGESVTNTAIGASYVGRGGSTSVKGYPTVHITGTWK